MAAPIDPLAGAWLVRARRRAGGEKGATLWSNAQQIHGNVEGGVKEGRSRANAWRSDPPRGRPTRSDARARKSRALGWDSGKVEGTSIASKPFPFARRRWTAVSASVDRVSRELSSPRDRTMPATRVPERSVEEGSSRRSRRSPSLTCSRPVRLRAAWVSAHAAHAGGRLVVHRGSRFVREGGAERSRRRGRAMRR